MLRRRLQMAGNGGGSLLPPELQACEWLEADNNSYIKTPYNCIQINYIKIKFLYTLAGTNISLFGQVSNPYLMIKGDSNADVALFCGNKVHLLGNQLNEWYNVLIENGNLVVNNVQIANDIVMPQSNNRIFPLFCRFNGNNINANGNGIRIAELDTNLFKMVDCYVNAGQTYTDNKGVECTAGTAGMYDTINHVFYTNDGTGSFTHGADIIL